MQRSQHITQADPRVFGDSYVTNCSSVEGLAAFLGEKTDHRHIDYFQGLEMFREQGLPDKLPVDRKKSLTESLKRDPRVLELEQEVQRLEEVQADRGNLGQSETKGCPVSRFSASESPRRISGGMGSAPKGVEDLEPGQAARDGHEWIRPASEPLFTSYQNVGVLPRG